MSGRSTAPSAAPRGRHVATGLALLLALPACLDRVLESPYVLTTGLGEVRSLAPGLDGRLLAATSTGLWAVTPEGRADRLDPAVGRAVSTHPGVVYVLADEQVSAGPGATVSTPGAVDVLAGYDEVVVAYPDRLDLHALDASTRRAVPVAGVRAVALGPPGEYLVVTADALFRVDATGVHPLVTGLVDARAASTDARGHVYVAHGAPTELFRLDDATSPATLAPVAKWLGDVRDLQFGVGPFPPQNLYIATGDGTLDYVRPP